MKKEMRTQADCDNAFRSLMGGNKRQGTRQYGMQPNTYTPKQNGNVVRDDVWQLQTKIDELNQHEQHIKSEKAKLKTQLVDLIKSLDGKNVQKTVE